MREIDSLLKIHNIITETNKTLEEIINSREIDKEISFIRNTEDFSYGKKVNINDYYTLTELLEF